MTEKKEEAEAATEKKENDKPGKKYDGGAIPKSTKASSKS